MGDSIKKPDHYCEGREYEPKDVIRDWGLNFNLGSAVKYISRTGRKGDKLEDLQKAKQFLQFEIEALAEVEDLKRIVKKIDNDELDCDDIPLNLSRNYQEIKDAIERKTSWYTNGILGRWYYYQNIPDGYKARVIDRIAQEVLDSQCDIALNRLTDEVRAAVIDRIVERINNGELNCSDNPGDLYCGYQDIRDAIARQEFCYVGEEQKSDVGMTCEEASEIGEGIVKGFEEGFKEAKEKYDESELDIYCRGFNAGYNMAHTDLRSVEDTFTISFKVEED